MTMTMTTSCRWQSSSVWRRTPPKRGKPRACRPTATPYKVMMHHVNQVNQAHQVNHVNWVDRRIMWIRKIRWIWWIRWNRATTTYYSVMMRWRRKIILGWLKRWEMVFIHVWENGTTHLKCCHCVWNRDSCPGKDSYFLKFLPNMGSTGEHWVISKCSIANKLSWVINYQYVTL